MRKRDEVLRKLVVRFNRHKVYDGDTDGGRYQWWTMAARALAIRRDVCMCVWGGGQKLRKRGNEQLLYTATKQRQNNRSRYREHPYVHHTCVWCAEWWSYYVCTYIINVYFIFSGSVAIAWSAILFEAILHKGTFVHQHRTCSAFRWPSGGYEVESNLRIIWSNI